jgi:hypothetical protein
MHGAAVLRRFLAAPAGERNGRPTGSLQDHDRSRSDPAGDISKGSREKSWPGARAGNQDSIKSTSTRGGRAQPPSARAGRLSNRYAACWRQARSLTNTDESRSPRRYGGRACNCRCAPPLAPLIPARPRASGIGFSQLRRATSRRDLVSALTSRIFPLRIHQR